MKPQDTYKPVDHDFYDLLEPHFGKKVKVYFFNPNMQVEVSIGILFNIISQDKAVFLEIQCDKTVRIDRIVTINGKPGPAYDEYDCLAQNSFSLLKGYEE